MRKLLLMTLSVLFALPYGFAQDNIVFPAAANVTDITQPPYNADNTGTVDVTAIIQAALNGSGNVVYLPNGTYLVSNTIVWPGSSSSQKRHTLVGQSTDGAIIKLANNASGYSDPSNTKSVIYTGKSPAQRFMNYIRNLTVNTGSGNPGATGIQYMSNNVGGMYDVLIKSGDGEGVYGLDLGYSDENGPCLIKNIEVQGYNIGIRAKHGVNGIVMENITISGQKDIGFLNDGQCVSLRKFNSTNSVRAIVNKSIGMLTMVEANIIGVGDASNVSAIFNTNGLYARDVTTSGYNMAIESIGGSKRNHEGAIVDEYVSHKILSQFPSPLKSLGLEIKETPQVPWGNTTDWVSITDFGPATDTTMQRCDGTNISFANWQKPMQQAIDAGYKTVYVPSGGDYIIVGDIYVRGNVERIHGMNRFLRGHGCDEREFYATFNVENGTASTVVIENFNSTYNEMRINHNSNRTLVLKDLEAHHITLASGAGELYIEDIFSGILEMASGTKAWARQLNMEGYEDHIINNNATLWVQGIKTEADGTIVTNTNGAKTEIVGGFVYANKSSDASKVMFINNESSLSVSLGEFESRNQPFNPVLEIRDGVSDTFTVAESPYGRAGGSLLPLYVSYKDENITSVPTAPSNLVATATTDANSVILEWQDNSTDEYGFHIEAKSDTSGSIFQEISSVSPNDTTYTLTGLFPATTYTFRLNAFNHVGSSGYSNEDTTSTVDDGVDGLEYQAERYTNRFNGYVGTSHSGYTDTAYFQLKYAGHWFEWDDIYVSTSGVNTLTFTYVNGHTSDRSCDIVVNGQVITTLNFPSTISWTNWSTISYNVSFQVGDNRVRIVYASNDNKEVEIDKMRVNSSPLPISPSGLTAEAISPVSTSISWSDKSNNETGFVLERKEEINGSYVIVDTLSADITSYTDTGLTPQVTYYYRVISYNEFGNSNYSIEASILMPSIFEIYQAESATANSGAVTQTSKSGYTGAGYIQFDTNGEYIEWNNVDVPVASTQPITIHYINEESETLTGDIIVNSTVVGSVNFASTGSGDTWSTVEINASFGLGTSTIRIENTSTSGNVLIVDKIEVGIENVPLPPSSLGLNAISSSQINLSWTDNSANELGFIVDRRTGISGTFDEIAVLGPNVTSYSDTGLVSSTQYTYQVRAYNNAGGSFYVENAILSASRPNEYQAESYSSKNGGYVGSSSSHAGFTGSGYFEYKYQGHWLQWADVDAASEGYYTLNFVYENADDTVKYLDLRLNGTVIETLVFPSTGGLGNWDTLQYEALLVGGENVIRLIYGTANLDLLAIDKMEVEAATPPPVDAPDNFVATGVSTSQIDLSWSDNSNNEDGFIIERKLVSDSEYTVVVTLGANTTSYSDTGLSSSTEYLYQISGYNNEGGSYLRQATGVTASAANVYQAEDYTGKSGGYITNSHVGYTGAGYFQFKYNAHGFEWDNVNVASTSIYTLDIRYTNGGDTSSKYCDLSVNGSLVGNIEFPTTGSWTTWDTITVNVALYAGDNVVELIYTSPDNNVIEIDKMEVSGGTADTEAPTTPSGLIASDTTGTSFILGWDRSTDNGGVILYEVFQDGVSLTDTITDNYATISGLSPLTSYIMTVKAIDASGNESSVSSSISVTTTAVIDTIAPSVPTGLTATSVTQSSFTLSWNAATDNVGVNEYEVYQDGVSIGRLAGTTTAITGLSADVTYSMSVKSIDAAGNASAQSAELDVSTSTPSDTIPPSAPTALVASSVTQTSFALSWDDSTDNVEVVSYEVYLDGSALSTTTNTSLDLTGLTSQTVYSVEVLAIDAAGNSSELSEALDVTTAAPSSSGEYQAEDYTSFYGAWSVSHSGYTGTGAMNLRYTAGSYSHWIEWDDVSASSSGTYALNIRYVTTYTGNRNVDIYVNGVEQVSNAVVPNTGSMTNWTVVTAYVTLNSGTNTIRITKSGDSKDLAIDKMNVEAVVQNYSIVASAGSNGAISPSGTVTLEEGSNQTFAITPDTGYETVDVLVDGSSVGAVSSYTFNDLSEDHTISVTFQAIAPTVYQAEDRTDYYGAWLKTSHAGYTGSAAVNLRYNDGNYTHWIEWDNVNVVSAGTYTLTFRYVTTYSGSRYADILVDGVLQEDDLEFTNTGTWTNWSTVTCDVTLAAGNNTIRFKKAGDDKDLELDKMEIGVSSARLADNTTISIEDEKIKLYPNPLINGNPLTVEGLSEGDIVTIYSLTGVTLLKQVATSEGLEIKHRFVQTGVLMLSVESKDRGVLWHKLMIKE